MRLIAPFIVAFALAGCGSATHVASTTSTNPTGMTSSTPVGLAIPAKVTPIHRVARNRGTAYAIEPLDRSTPVTYAWRCGGRTGDRATWSRPCNGTLHVTVQSQTWRCTAATGEQPVCLKR
jgi:hypothetical protein